MKIKTLGTDFDQTWGQITKKNWVRFDQILGTDKPKTKGQIDRDGLICERIDWHPMSERRAQTERKLNGERTVNDM